MRGLCVALWASAADVDMIGLVAIHCGCATLVVRALCVCVSVATRAYGLIVTGCSVGGVYLSLYLFFGYLVPPPEWGKAGAFPEGVNVPV